MRLRGRGLHVDVSLLVLLLLLQALGVHRDPTVAVQLLSLRRHHLVVCSRAVVSRLLVLFAAVPPVEIRWKSDSLRAFALLTVVQISAEATPTGVSERHDFPLILTVHM